MKQMYTMEVTLPSGYEGISMNINRSGQLGIKISLEGDDLPPTADFSGYPGTLRQDFYNKLTTRVALFSGEKYSLFGQWLSIDGRNASRNPSASTIPAWRYWYPVASKYSTRSLCFPFSNTVVPYSTDAA
ncbi:MAG: hypothetical protein RLY31_412 [Bacteroidota bacterium]